jgi:hypothetical protein
MTLNLDSAFVNGMSKCQKFDIYVLLANKRPVVPSLSREKS